MTTNRTRRTRTQSQHNGITEADYLFFAYGSYFEAEGYEDGKTKQELKAFWKKNREVILERYLSEEKYPGLRPRAFWLYDAVEPRLATAPKEYQAMQTYDHHRKIYGWFETDIEYLKRLNLLTENEQNATKKP